MAIQIASTTLVAVETGNGIDIEVLNRHIEGDEEVLVDLTLTSGLLSYTTSSTCDGRSIGIVSILEEALQVGLTLIAVTCLSVKTETIGSLEVVQEVVVQLQLAIEALTFLLVLEIIHYPVGVGDAVRCIVITWGVERIVHILQLCDTDIAWGLHDGIVHRATALTSGHEAVLLVSVVHVGADCYSLHLLAGVCREGVLGVAVCV